MQHVHLLGPGRGTNGLELYDERVRLQVSSFEATRAVRGRWEGMTARIFNSSVLRQLSTYRMPRALRLSIHHAERLVAFLGQVEPQTSKDARLRNSGAAAWLLGRRQEVECFVLDVTLDIRRQKVSESHAAKTIDAYLTVLHKGLARHFGERFPACCASSAEAVHSIGESTPTVVYGSSGALARSGTRRVTVSCSRAAERARAIGRAQSAGIPPEDLLAGLASRVDW
jgi:hypothetical protein